MKNLNLGRCALSVYMASILFAGCGAQSPIGAPGGIPSGSKLSSPYENRVTRNASNHVFDATYSGKDYCEGDDLYLDGRGTASIRGFRTKSHESVDYAFCAGSGSFTLTGRSSHDTITGSVSGDHCFTETFTVTGGTGRYSGATGSGTVTIACRGKHHYKDTWSGTISY